MCGYDDMVVLVDPSVVARVCCSKNTTTSTSTSSSLTNRKTFLWKTIGWAKVCLLLLLVLNPASAVPVTRWRRTAKQHTAEQQRHIQEEHTPEQQWRQHIAQQEYISEGQRRHILGEHSTPRQHHSHHHRVRALEQQEEHLGEYTPKQEHIVEEYTPEQEHRVGEHTPKHKHIIERYTSEQQHHLSQQITRRLLRLAQQESEQQGIEQELHRQQRSSRRMGDETDNAAASRGRRDVPHWSEPCTGLMIDENNTPQSLSEHIVHSLNQAYSYINKGDFKNKFANESLKYSTWDDLVSHVTSKGVVFDFLEMPEAADSSFPTTLLHSYERMQRVAVGIEQVTLDQALYQGSLLTEFRTIENYIVRILCNLHHAMIHQSLAPTAEVTKEIMSEHYRDLEGDSGARGLRDAVIVMKFNDAIEDLSKIFTAFKDNPPQ